MFWDCQMIDNSIKSKFSCPALAIRTPHSNLLSLVQTYFHKGLFPYYREMVFCYQNCFDLLWEKNVLVIEKNFEAEGWEFAKSLRSQEQFIRTSKGNNNFLNRILFKLVPGCFSDLMHYNNYNSSLKNWDLETYRKS